MPAPAPAPAPAAPVSAAASDWTAVKDGSSGDTYYFNPKTGETTWDTPPGFVESAASPAVAAPAPAPAAPAPSSPASTAPAPIAAPAVPQVAKGWQAVLDTASGEYYYFNASTGETSWDKPAEFAAASPATTASSAAPVGPAPKRKVLSVETKAAWKSVLERAKADTTPSASGDAAPAATEGAPGFEGLRAFAESMKQKRERKVADSTVAAGGADETSAPAVDKL